MVMFTMSAILPLESVAMIAPRLEPREPGRRVWPGIEPMPGAVEMVDSRSRRSPVTP